MHCSQQNVSVKLISPVSFHGFLWLLESLKAFCFHWTEVVRDLKKVPDFNTVSILSSGKTQRWSLHSGCEWERRSVDGEQEAARGEERERPEDGTVSPRGASAAARMGPSGPTFMPRQTQPRAEGPGGLALEEAHLPEGATANSAPAAGWQSSGGMGSPSIPAALSPLPPPLA